MLDARDVVEHHHRPLHFVLQGADRHHADIEVPRRLAQGVTFQHHFLLPGLAALDRLADDHLHAGLAQRFEHRPAHGTLAHLKQTEQFLVHQPHDMALVDHHDPLDHVGQQDVEIELLLALLALILFQLGADRFQMAGDLLDHRRPADEVGLRALSDSKLPSQTAHLPQGKPIAVMEKGPKPDKLKELQHPEQHKQRMVVHSTPTLSRNKMDRHDKNVRTNAAIPGLLLPGVHVTLG